jgi:glycosyltransferase involved in cell wall biosynthesis
MSQPTISILIPTKGGGDLLYVLQTISTQELIDGDEVLIIGDGPQPQVAEQVDALGPPFRYAHTSTPTGDFGHTQLNYGLELARGEYIMGTDDDDGYLPRAIESVRAALMESPGRPHLFKFWSNDRYLVWNEDRGRKIEETYIGGHNLVLPNVEGKKGKFPSRYRGDFDWVKGVLSCYAETDWVWRGEILTRQRPNAKLMAWPVWKRDSINFERLEALRTIRNECRMELTHYQAEISWAEQQVWAAGLDREENWAWVYTVKAGDPSDYLGYTYLKRRDGFSWPSYGVAESHRGKGWSKHIVRHAMDACQGPAKGDAFETNKAILHVDREVGWRETGRENGLVLLEFPWPK